MRKLSRFSSATMPNQKKYGARLIFSRFFFTLCLFAKLTNDLVTLNYLCLYFRLLDTTAN